MKDAEEFNNRKKTAEAAEVKKAADEKIIKSVYSAIDSYLPVDKQGRIAHGKKSSVQEQLRNYVAGEAMSVIAVTAVVSTKKR